MTTDIIFQMMEKPDLKGSTLVYGFPGPGLSCSMVVNHLIKEAGLDPVGSITSPDLPPVAVVKDYVPMHLVRMYNKGKLLVLTAEMQVATEMNWPLMGALFEFAQKWKMDRIIGLETVVDREAMETIPGGDLGGDGEKKVFCISSSPDVSDRVCGEGVERFKEGVISGLSGLLLSEGGKYDVDIICLLTPVNPMYPDAQGAIRLLRALKGFDLGIDLKEGELQKMAKEIEEKVKDAAVQAQNLLQAHQGGAAPAKPSDSVSYMYR